VDALPAAMLALGLATGLHCVGMCGGIVAAFQGRRVIPIADAARSGAARPLASTPGASRPTPRSARPRARPAARYR
jgi:hypothetical protein